MKNINEEKNFRKFMKRFATGLLVAVAMIGAGSALADSNLQLFDENIELTAKKDGTPIVTYDVHDSININKHGAYIVRDDKGNTIYGDGYNNTKGERVTAVEIKGTKEGECGAGKYKLDIGNAEAKAGITVGAYRVVDANGKASNCIGVKAEAGAGVSALDIKADGYLGSKENNVKAGVNANLLSAGAHAGAEVGMCNGQVMARGEVGGEATAFKAEGTVGGTVAGVETKVGGSVIVGAAATAKAEYKDGKFKAELGAALGVGASIKVEIDVDAIADKADDAAAALSDLIHGRELSPLYGTAYEKVYAEDGTMFKTRSTKVGNLTLTETKGDGMNMHMTMGEF